MENLKDGQNLDLENQFLEKVIETEGLLISKAKVYSRLLTDTALAEAMSGMALKREKSKSAWLEILTGEPQETSGNQQTEEQGGDEQ